jgi:hypothetical protein
MLHTVWQNSHNNFELETDKVKVKRPAERSTNKYLYIKCRMECSDTSLQYQDLILKDLSTYMFRFII